jgi:hypothetical protein
MMKAIRLLEWGQPVQREDLPLPQPGDDDISWYAFMQHRSIRLIVWLPLAFYKGC